MESGSAVICVRCAEEGKCRKYTQLFAEALQFEPIAGEIMAVYGGSTGVILKAIGWHLVEATREPREANWFRQKFAIAIQRSNAFIILSVGRGGGLYRVGRV